MMSARIAKGSTTTDLYVIDTMHAADIRLFAGGEWVNDCRTRCPECGVFTQDSEPPTIEIELRHIGRRGFTEHLWASHGLPIFRQDLVARWTESHLTGVSTKRVCLLRGHPTVLPTGTPTYFRVVPTSEVHLVTPAPSGCECSTCGFLEYAFPKLGSHLELGIAVDPRSWDGSDLFGLRQYPFLFCTRRLAEMTLRAGYGQHVAFVRMSDYLRWDEYNVTRWSPQDYRRHVETFLIRDATAL
jgi:hypothetical protein